MFSTKSLSSLNRDELVALVVQLREQVAQLTVVIEGLRKEITELKRAGKRQAAPFSKGTRKAKSQPPRPQARDGTLQLPKAAVAR